MNTTEPQQIFLKVANARVVQDNDARSRIFAASDQPRIPSQPAHMPKTAKPHGSNKRRTVEIGVCLMPTVKAELERLGEQWGTAEKPLSNSKVAATLIEKGIQGHIDMQYGAMLKPVIEAIVDRLFQRYLNRISNLALRSYYAAEQSRIIGINILRFILAAEVNEDGRNGGLEELDLIISNSQTQAWENLKHHVGEQGQQEKS